MHKWFGKKRGNNNKCNNKRNLWRNRNCLPRISVEKYKEQIEKNIIVPSGKKIIYMTERDMEVER